MKLSNKITSSLLLLTILSFTTISTNAQKSYKKLEEAKGIAVGATAQPFVAIDQFGKPFDLNKALTKGPVVIMFYRGQWCPVCNRHLSHLQDSLSYIYATGATIVAISPEKPENLVKTAKKTKATFTLLYDEDYTIASAFDVLYKPKKTTTALYNTFAGANLKEAQSDESQRLPIPATFIIDQNSIVVWRQFNPNYKVRASVAEIVAHIPKTKANKK